MWLAEWPDGPARPLATTPDVDEYAPRWSPDGERLAVTVVPAGEDLRLDGDSFDRARVRVLERDGRVAFETPGLMPDWMPAW